MNIVQFKIILFFFPLLTEKDAETTINMSYCQGVPDPAHQQLPTLKPIESENKVVQVTPKEVSKPKDGPLQVPKPTTRPKFGQHNPESFLEGTISLGHVHQVG